MGHISRQVMAILMLMVLVKTGDPAKADGQRRTVDLIPLIDVNRDAIEGTWTLDNGAIDCGDQGVARLKIPYDPPHEYDFQVEFVRRSGNDTIGQIFRSSSHDCMWVLGGWNNTVFGFENVDGREANDQNNPTANYGAMLVKNSQRHSSIIRVRKDSISASFDGKTISTFSGDPSRLSTGATYSVGDDGIGLLSKNNQVTFTVIRVIEISGAGTQLPHYKPGKNNDNQRPDETADTTKFRADSDVDDGPISGPTTRVSNPISTIKTLEVYTTDSGLMLGRTSDAVLTITRGNTAKATSIRFVTPIGEEMSLARDEALRFIRITYPNWYADTAEFSFEDKYVAHDGGSIGAAVGTLILSAIQGFNIDPDTAITGDISANGKVRAIGGLSAKLHGAIASNCSAVAVPTENFGQLVDAMVYNGPAIMVDTQVIGIANLDDAIAVMREDRDPKLLQAIRLFDQVQEGIKKTPAYLSSPDAREKLTRVLKLAPNHLSAKLLLMVANGEQPKTLSATASMYYTFVAVRGMLPILTERSENGSTQIPSTVVKDGLADLKKLRPLADESIRPLIDAWSRFIWGWNLLQNGNSDKETFLAQAQAVDDAMAKLQANQALMQKMLKEGI
jgi:Lon protease (S16) C-terminal proteolytic domain